MRKKSKSAAILAVVMAMTLAGSSAVYAEENSSAKTAETDDNEKEDTRSAENEPAPCNEGERKQSCSANLHRKRLYDLQM